MRYGARSAIASGNNGTQMRAMAYADTAGITAQSSIATGGGADRQTRGSHADPHLPFDRSR